MTTAEPTSPPSTQVENKVTAQQLISVHNCNRLGRSANPPSLSLPDCLSLPDWLRRSR